MAKYALRFTSGDGPVLALGEPTTGTCGVAAIQHVHTNISAKGPALPPLTLGHALWVAFWWLWYLPLVVSQAVVGWLETHDVHWWHLFL